MNDYRYWMPGGLTGAAKAHSPKDAAAQSLNLKFQEVTYCDGNWQQPIGATFIGYNGKTVKIWATKEA